MTKPTLADELYLPTLTDRLYAEMTEALWYETTCTFSYGFSTQAASSHPNNYLLSLMLSAGTYIARYSDFYIANNGRLEQYIFYQKRRDWSLRLMPTNGAGLYVTGFNAAVGQLARDAVYTFLTFYPKITILEFLEQSPIEIICTP